MDKIPGSNPIRNIQQSSAAEKTGSSHQDLLHNASNIAGKIAGALGENIGNIQESIDTLKSSMGMLSSLSELKMSSSREDLSSNQKLLQSIKDNPEHPEGAQGMFDETTSLLGQSNINEDDFSHYNQNLLQFAQTTSASLTANISSTISPTIQKADAFQSKIASMMGKLQVP